MTALFDLIESRLAGEGDRLAIDSGKHGSICYARLRELVDALAASSTKRGPVAILANRSAAAYVAVVACYRAGRPFVPLNPSFPAARLRKIVARSEAVECFFESRHEALSEQLELPGQRIDLEARDDKAAACKPAADVPVYHLFTSGSTGEPKGVPIRHEALSHYVENIVETVGIGEGLRATQFFDLSFDLAMHDIFVTLATGGTIVPASDIDLMMPHRFVSANSIDVWFSVPLVAVAAARGQSAMPVEPRLQKVLFCGEALPGGYARSMRDLLVPEGEIWNLYGPTEATIAFTAHQLDDQDFERGAVPLGRPFGDNEIAILSDNRVEPAAAGREGELLLGGPQVFSGYCPPTDASPFVRDACGRDFYRTGDLVREVDGNLHYIGRLDSQVKIRGHRVELGEIESACKRLDGVEAAAAIVAGDSANPIIILAYQGDANADFADLSSCLPAYMLPREFHRLEQLPTNVNGKIDRKQIRETLCGTV